MFHKHDEQSCLENNRYSDGKKKGSKYSSYLFWEKQVAIFVYKIPGDFIDRDVSEF